MQPDPNSVDNSLMLGHVLRQAGLSRGSVADALGVSEDSVDNWCSGRSRITLEHLDKLIGLLQQRGCPSSVLSHLVTSKLREHGLADNSLSLLRPSQDEWECPYILACGNLDAELERNTRRGVVVSFTRLKALIDVLDLANQPFLPDAFVQRLVERRPPGVLLCYFPLDESHVTRCAELFNEFRIPAVFLYNRPSRAYPRQSTICFDDRAIGQAAAELLLARGHTRIGMLCFAGNPMQMARLEGYQSALQGKGISVDDALIAQVPSDRNVSTPISEYNAAYDHALERLLKDAGATGIICASSVLTVECVHRLRRMGVKWPGDVSLVSISSNTSFAQWMDPPIAMIALPAYEVGMHGGQMVRQLASAGSDATSATQSIVLGAKWLVSHNLENGSIGRPAGTTTRH